MILPEAAPMIGSRVRLADTGPTFGGTSFEAGEIAIVSEIHLMPIGAVRLTVRTPDGRKQIILRSDSFEVL
jgi:hypothetical protein